jgi:hypothetical protein
MVVLGMLAVCVCVCVVRVAIYVWCERMGTMWRPVCRPWLANAMTDLPRWGQLVDLPVLPTPRWWGQPLRRLDGVDAGVSASSPTAPWWRCLSRLVRCSTSGASFSAAAPSA